MGWIFRARFIASLLVFSATSFAQTTPSSETHLRFHYSVQCPPADQNSFPGIIGETTFRGRTLRFYLYRYLNDSGISLGVDGLTGPTRNELTFKFFPSSGCTLQNFEPTLERASLVTESNRDAGDTLQNHSVNLSPKFIASLALKHSPYLILRPDEISLPERDAPLGIAYSVLPTSSGFAIRYTFFFSNETVSGLFSTSKSISLGSWGRRSDIEWIYQVNFANDGTLQDRFYQGGIIFGIGHLTRHFNGRYLPGTAHPVLYNLAKHNVFGTKPATFNLPYRQVGTHLIPEEEIKTPLARERWLWERPWTFDVTDRELRRDGKLSHPSNEYVYVDLQGTLGGGKIQVSALQDNTKILAGDGSATIKNLGEDLFGVESFSAIRLNPNPNTKSTGLLHIKRSTAKTNLNFPKFYGLIPDEQNGFQVEDLSVRFTCATPYDCSYAN